MIPQENIESDFKDWLGAVRATLEIQIFMELPGKRIQKLGAYILLRKPAKMMAQEMVDQLPEYLIEELSDKPLESLVEELAKEMNSYLLSYMSQTMTNWLEKGIREDATGISMLRPKQAPGDVALQLIKTMADNASDYIFCPPDGAPPTPPVEEICSPFSIKQHFSCHTVPYGFSFDQPGFLALLTRAHAVRFRVAGMAAIMLYNKIRERKTINEEGGL